MTQETMPEDYKPPVFYNSDSVGPDACRIPCAYITHVLLLQRRRGETVLLSSSWSEALIPVPESLWTGHHKLFHSAFLAKAPNTSAFALRPQTTETSHLTIRTFLNATAAAYHTMMFPHHIEIFAMISIP